MKHTYVVLEFVFIGLSILAFNPNGYAITDEDMICTDISHIDFKNHRIDIRNRGSVRLENGTGFSSDAGEGGNSKDWEISLVQDEILNPTSFDVLRLIKVNSYHKTGTGGIWEHLYIIKCDNGKIVRVFQGDYLFGVKVHKTTDAELQFISLELLKEDAMCCPSQQKISTYKWDTEKRVFTLHESIMRPVIRK